MGCQFGVPGGTYPPKKYPSAPPGIVLSIIIDHLNLILIFDFFFRELKPLRLHSVGMYDSFIIYYIEHPFEKVS